jgi:C_GCAxxG_C_C family probable redox protein
MDRSDRAVSIFRSGCNCSQAVFSAYSDLLGVEERQARSIAAGFGGGIGRLQKTCGAVTGAVMLLGLKYYDEENAAASKAKSYEKVRDFISLYEEKHGSVNCLDILGVDINTDEGMNKAREQNLFETKCREYVRDAAKLLADFL